jgi:hypothetical protein
MGCYVGAEIYKRLNTKKEHGAPKIYRGLIYRIR